MDSLANHHGAMIAFLERYASTTFVWISAWMTTFGPLFGPCMKNFVDRSI
jgi:hypothetical protein